MSSIAAAATMTMMNWSCVYIFSDRNRRYGRKERSAREWVFLGAAGVVGAVVSAKRGGLIFAGV